MHAEAIAGRGRTINISSGAGVAASRTGLHPYTAAKHAIVGVTRQPAAELGTFGITLNVVAPGLVFSSANTRKLWDGMSARGEIDDVANAVLFFVSARMSWISGHVLSVDGGTR